MINPVGNSSTRSDQIRGSIQLLSFASKVLGFALLLALSSKISIPIPGSPVPATLQVLAVLAAGAFLGPWGGAASVSVYLLSGVAGAPVFAMGGGPAYLMGPTGGYLLGFLPAACVAGFLSRHAGGFWSLAGSFIAAVAVIHLSGWAQLSAWGGPGEAFRMGVAPFVALDLLKALLMAGLVRGVRARHGK